jgi:protein-L-isoaspartate(D-aspartate) O-methyltransferase
MTDGAESTELVAHLRKRGIHDTRVLTAIETVPREMFVTPSFTTEAYVDTALPIACGQTISQPFVVAYMTEKLGVCQDHDVLEIGTGSGYQAAILAQLCRRVFSIERHEKLHLEAKSRLARLKLTNVALALGDGSHGWPEERTFDRIIVTAAAAETPVALLHQLGEGGRLIVPIGKQPERQKLVRYDRTPQGIVAEDLLPVRFVPLVEDA